MSLRYRLRRSRPASHWTIVDVFTGWPVRLEGRDLKLTDEAQACALAAFLNRTEVGQGRPTAKPPE
jgi:hypothetical protein